MADRKRMITMLSGIATASYVVMYFTKVISGPLASSLLVFLLLAIVFYLARIVFGAMIRD